jgi:hypothetical protein
MGRGEKIPTTQGAIMPQFNWLLHEREKQYLEAKLKSALGETRVEAHRTHYSPEYRQQVLGEEELVRQLLAKVQKAV